MKRITEKLIMAALLIFATVVVYAQNPAPPGTTTVQVASVYYAPTAITATGTGSTQVTLTIPAPVQSGFYNYVCYLGFQASNEGILLASSVGGAVTTSTNFNATAAKLSLQVTNGADSGIIPVIPPMTPPACPKSVSPTTATTFVSPASTTNVGFSWYAVYYQAP